MSVNVYVKKEASENITALATLRLNQEKGRWFFELKSSNSPMPESVAGLVEEISFMEWILFYGGREAGIYSYESARADIQLEKSDDGRMKVVILSKNMRDLRKLLHLLKVGDINPKVSYEVPQGGKSRAELEAEVSRMLRVNKHLEAEINQLQSAWQASVSETLAFGNELAKTKDELAEAKDKLNRIRIIGKGLDLDGGLCRQKRVAGKIYAILADQDKPSEG